MRSHWFPSGNAHAEVCSAESSTTVDGVVEGLFLHGLLDQSHSVNRFKKASVVI